MEKANKTNIFQKRFKELVGDTATQEEIAGKVNTSRQNVGNWLNGKSKPDIYALAEISKGYGVSTDWLLGLTDIKTNNVALQDTCKYTGLSENSINILLAYKEIQEYTKNKDVPSKYSLVDTLNFILAEFGEDSDLIFSLTNALNYNNSGFNFDDDEDVRDEFDKIFPDASKWLEGKGEIYGRDEHFTLFKSRLEHQFGFMVANILCLYNPTDFDKKFGANLSRRSWGNIFQLLKSEKEYHSQIANQD